MTVVSFALYGKEYTGSRVRKESAVGKYYFAVGGYLDGLN
jgi:hypothetical protein